VWIFGNESGLSPEEDELLVDIILSTTKLSFRNISLAGAG
jgi:hypothetical protein